MLTLGSASQALANETVELRVLTHTDASAQTMLAIEYFAAERPDVEITLIETANQSELLELAAMLDASGEAPDVIVADHFLGDSLGELGLGESYCLPDSGCEVCYGSNPPPWCPYAQGIDVTPGRLDNFGIISLCDIDRCPDVCLQFPMPEWCQLIHAPQFELHAPDYGYDILRGVFADRWKDVIMPRGIPWWWTAHVVWANEALGFSAGETISVEDLEGLVNELEGYVYLDSTVVFEQTGLETQLEPNFQKGEPTPQPNLVGLFFGFTDTFRLLDPELQASLVPLHVEGYRPEMVVSGAYVVPSGAAQRPDVAMDFAYTVFSAGFQEQMAFGTEYLSVQSDVFAPAVEQLMPAATWDVLNLGIPHVPESF